jgi:uracil-DNA glycosylase
LSATASVPSWDELERAVAQCTMCALSVTRRNPVFGSGPREARLAVIGEGPGAKEDERGIPFVGRSGALLDSLLSEVVGISRDEVFVTNIVKCRPPENRDPTKDEVAACEGYLVAQLAHVDPQVVVTLGNVATRTILKTTDGITRLRGVPTSTTLIAAPVVPTFHPAAALRGGTIVREKMRDDFAVVASLLEQL